MTGPNRNQQFHSTTGRDAQMTINGKRFTIEFRTHLSVLTCILAGIACATTTEAAPICSGGQVIRFNGTIIGCRFPGPWTTADASMCQGDVVLQHVVMPAIRNSPGTCFTCVAAPYDKQILASKWTGFTEAANGATPKAATFPECVANEIGPVKENPNLHMVEACPSLSFSFKSRSNSTVVNASLALTESASSPVDATNVTITSVTCTAGFVYAVPKVPYAVPGAANMTQNSTTVFNTSFTATPFTLHNPFSCTITWTAATSCTGTQTVSIP